MASLTQKINTRNEAAYAHQGGGMLHVIKAKELKHKDRVKSVPPTPGEWREIKIHDMKSPLLAGNKSGWYDRLNQTPWNDDWLAGWSGSAVGADGLIYCAPFNKNWDNKERHQSLLIIDPDKQTAYVWGSNFGDYPHICAHPNGNLYLIPGTVGTDAGGGLVEIDPVAKTYHSFFPDDHYGIMGTSFSSTNGANGSGYSTGTGIATTGGTGTGCTVDIHTVDGNGAIQVLPDHGYTINNKGKGYTVGDEVTITGGNGAAKFEVLGNTFKMVGWESWEGNFNGAAPGVIYGTDVNDYDSGLDKWIHGVLAPNNDCIYCIPKNADKVLKIDPVNKKFNLVGSACPDIGLTDNPTHLQQKYGGAEKYCHGVLGADGMIYMIGDRFQGIGKIDPFTDTVSWLHLTITESMLPGMTLIKEATYDYTNWTSTVGTAGEYTKRLFESAALGPDGKIYIVPKSFPWITVYDPKTNSIEKLGPGASCAPALVMLLNETNYLDHYNDYIDRKNKTDEGEGLKSNFYFGNNYWAMMDELDTDGNTYTHESGDKTTFDNTHCVLDYMPSWTGAVLAQDGCIYSLPTAMHHGNNSHMMNYNDSAYNIAAGKMIKINPATSTWEFVELEPWYGEKWSQIVTVDPASPDTLQSPKNDMMKVFDGSYSTYVEGPANGTVRFKFDPPVDLNGISVETFSHDTEFRCSADQNNWYTIGTYGDDQLLPTPASLDPSVRSVIEWIEMRGLNGNPPQLSMIRIEDRADLAYGSGSNALIDKGKGHESKLTALGRHPVLAPNGKIYTAPSFINRMAKDIAYQPNGVFEYAIPSVVKPAEWLYGPYTSNK